MPVIAEDLRGIDGQRLDPALVEGKALLIVNVASNCGLTPKYEGLERLQARFGDAGRRDRRPVPSSDDARRSSDHGRDRARAVVTTASATVKASEVRLGDRVRARSGTELTVTRIDKGFMGNPDMLALDSDEQWLKVPVLREGDVELIQRV